MPKKSTRCWYLVGIDEVVQHHHEHEDVVDGERVLDHVAGQELRARPRARPRAASNPGMRERAAGRWAKRLQHEAVEAEVEERASVTHTTLQVAASLKETAWALRWKTPEVQREQHAHEGGEAGVEPPVLARTGTATTPARSPRRHPAAAARRPPGAARRPSSSVWPQEARVVAVAGSRCGSARRGSPRGRARRRPWPRPRRPGCAPRPRRGRPGRARHRPSRRPGTPAAPAGRPRRARGRGPPRRAAAAARRPRRRRGARRLGSRPRRLPAAARRAGLASADHRLRGARAEDQALEQRVAGQAVGAVDAVAGHLPGGVEAGQRGAAVEVGGHAAHHVVGGRRHRAPDRA